MASRVPTSPTNRKPWSWAPRPAGLPPVPSPCLSPSVPSPGSLATLPSCGLGGGRHTGPLPTARLCWSLVCTTPLPSPRPEDPSTTPGGHRACLLPSRGIAAPAGRTVTAETQASTPACSGLPLLSGAPSAPPGGTSGLSGCQQLWGRRPRASDGWGRGCPGPEQKLFCASPRTRCRAGRRGARPYGWSRGQVRSSAPSATSWAASGSGPTRPGEPRTTELHPSAPKPTL